MFRRKPEPVSIGGMDAEGLARLLDDLYRKPVDYMSELRNVDYCPLLWIRHKDGKFYVKLDGRDGEWLINRIADQFLNDRYEAREEPDDE